MNFLPNWNSDINELIGFSKIKLIVSDIDGTLLKTGTHHDHEKLNRTVRYLWTKGVHMTFATGRAFNGVKELTQRFPLANKTPLILYNGSLAIMPSSESIIFIKTIENPALRKLVALSKKYHVQLFAYLISSDLYGQTINKDFKEKVYAWGSCENDHNEPNGLSAVWNDPINNEMIPVAIIIKRPENTNDSEEILKEIKKIKNISFTKSSNKYIEIRPINSHKGSAIEILCNNLNINKSEVLTIGDNDNDVEMFKYAGVSVAVNNSSMAALEAGKYRSHDDDILGVIETLELIKQAYRYSPVIRAGIK